MVQVRGDSGWELVFLVFMGGFFIKVVVDCRKWQGICKKEEVVVSCFKSGFVFVVVR